MININVQAGSQAFNVLIDANVQSFFLGIAALLVLLVGIMTLIVNYLRKEKKHRKVFKNLNFSQKEIMKLLLDIEEVPKKEIKNLINIENINKDLNFLEAENLIYIKKNIEEDTDIIYLNKEKLNENNKTN